MLRVSIEGFKPQVDSDQYPIEFVRAHSLLKLRETGDSVTVGTCLPVSTVVWEELKNYHGKKLRFFLVEKSELAAWLGSRMSGVTDRKPSQDVYLNRRASLLIDRLETDAPTVNLVNSILIDGIRRAASDIHIEVDAEETVVRYRIDGGLQTIHRFTQERFKEVSSRVKVMANLNIMERRLPQDGRITVHLDRDVFDIRVSIIPIVGGESIVLRLFNKKRKPLNIDQLGVQEDILDRMKDLYHRAQGLMLVTGPTGSGKTTTLNAVLRDLRSESLKIVTIEDPVEYITDGVDQIQTNEKIGLTFDTILKRVLRQDPNIIMVGEIRDLQTAELAVRAALTGHLVFSTLHTKDSVSVITRLKNMGIERYLIAAVLKGALAQRLVRKICDICRIQKEVGHGERALLRQYGLDTDFLFQGKGCDHCSGTGFSGRTGIFELFLSNEEVESIIASDGKESEVRGFLLTTGMERLVVDGLKKACRGITTIGEVQRVTEE